MRSIYDVIQDHKSVCWYPSAGADFREFLYLSEAYLQEHSIPLQAPDLFLLTDAAPMNIADFQTGNSGEMAEKFSQIAKINAGRLQRGDCLFEDRSYYFYPENQLRTREGLRWNPESKRQPRTRMTVERIEELEPLTISAESGKLFLRSYLPTDDGADNTAEPTGKAYFIRVAVHCSLLGDWKIDLVYALTENTAFAKEYLLPQQMQIDTVITIRYGGSFGGSILFGDWIARVLKSVGTKCFIANDDYFDGERDLGNENLMRYWPELAQMPVPRFENIYMVTGRNWSNYGNVYWKMIH